MQACSRDDDEERYYFHVKVGSTIHPDVIGQELESIDEAMNWAMQVADRLDSNGENDWKWVTVEDESGEEVARLVVTKHAGTRAHPEP